MHTETEPKTEQRNAKKKTKKITVAHIKKISFRWRRRPRRRRRAEVVTVSSSSSHFLFVRTHRCGEFATKNLTFRKPRYVVGWMNGRHCCENNSDTHSTQHAHRYRKEELCAIWNRTHSKTTKQITKSCKWKGNKRIVSMRSAYPIPRTYSNHTIPKTKLHSKKVYNRKWNKWTQGSVHGKSALSTTMQRRRKDSNPTNCNKEVNNGFY